MKTYDLVKKTLLQDRMSRNSDKRLMFLVWKHQGLDVSRYDDWKTACHPKSIIESRRILQRKQEEVLKRGEYVPESELLVADETFLKYRNEINHQKGTHIFREEAVQKKLV